MTIERKVLGVMVPYHASISEVEKEASRESLSMVGDLITREICRPPYDKLLAVLKDCNDDGEFEFTFASKNYKLRVLHINLLEVEPTFDNLLEEIKHREKPKINSYHSLSWHDYNTLGRPQSFSVEEIVRFSPPNL